MRHVARSFALIAVMLLVIGTAVPANAGTATLSWNPVTDTDLAGYRIYYGTSPSSYTQSLDVGNVTQATISGLTDCTTYYFGVKAYDTAANESATYSNQVTGWSRPVVTSVTPSSAEQGRTLSLTIAGSSFQAGAIATFANAGIVVNSTTVSSCGQLVVNVTIGASAATGATSLDVMDTDRVFGTGAGIFTVVAATPPTVTSTTPADGANGVSIAVTPSVAFSEAMLPASITSATVRLLNDTGAAVTQAAGSPVLSGDGLTATITPAAPLTQGKTYRIQVAGGVAGVLDLGNHGLASTLTQATGFSTVADTTPPIISGVSSSGIGGTTASILWTTNESSDSQVFYRKQGSTAYQQTAVDATLVVSHTVGLAGLDSSTTYEFFVRSADGAGNAATSSPTKIFATTASSFAYLRFEAEAGTLVAPVRANGGASGAFGSGYLDTPAGTLNGSATSPAGTANFGVNVPAAGTWYLWVRMFGPDASTDAWYESVNGASLAQIVPSVVGQWQWVAGRSYTLPIGLATVELAGRNAQARADRLILTNDPTFTPTEQPVGDQVPPSSDTGLTAAGAAAQVTLTWTNSTSADFTQTIIRYRTDGKYPVSPVDGLPVTAKPATPGSTDGFVHTGLISGATCYYSAFALDASGNVARAVTVTVVLADTTPPANVQNLQRGDKK